MPRTDIPAELPFLEGLSWFARLWRDPTPFDRLRRYESGGRWRGVLADPSAAELEFARALARTYGSVLDP